MGGRGATRRRERNSHLVRWQFLAVLIALVIVVPTFVYLSYYSDDGPYAIDGDFGEWDEASTFSMFSQSTSESLNVEEWAVAIDGDDLYLYVDSQGDIMASSMVESLFLFVDMDGSAETGYSVGALGAEYLLETDGWNGTVQTTALYAYGSADDKYDWSEWSRAGSVESRLRADEMEAMATIGQTIAPGTEFLLLTQDQLERRAVSHAVPATGGILIVKQELTPSAFSDGIVHSSSSVQLLRLTFYAQGADGTVSSVSPFVVGSAWHSEVPEFTLTSGETQMIDISVDTSGSAVSSLISAGVAVDGVVTTFDQVRVIGEPAKAYVGEAPEQVQIDGAFGDWSERTFVDKDDSAPGNSNIDIDEYGNASAPDQASFYISVEGDSCCGTFVPVVRGKPTTGGSGTVVPVRRTAEDVTRVYVDVDRDTSSGKVMTFGSKVIGADRLIEVRGLQGNIVSTTAWTFAGTSWEITAYSVTAANDHKRLEVGIEAGAFGWTTDIDFVIETTDWRSRTDWSDPDPFAYAGVKTWLVDSAATSSTATDSSVQRKLFYDGVNIWSFYFDGANTVCRYSTDLGQTWNAPTDSQPFVAGGVDKVSIWYDSASNMVYVIGDTSNPSQSASIQRGVVSPASHSISWASSDGGAPVSSTNRGTKNTYISMDASGYLWAMGTSRVNSNNYNLVVVKGNAPGDFRNWTSTGTMLAAGVSQSTLKGSVLPAGTGSDVWAVYVYNGDVAARKYTSGAWGAETVIYDNSDIAITDIAPPSAAVDSAGKVHVVFGDSHTDAGTLRPHIRYAFNSTATSWPSTTVISSSAATHGYRYPTVSLETSANGVYAFFVNSSASTQNEIIALKKASVGLSWSPLTLPNHSTNAKTYLTSIYSVAGEDMVCIQWTETIPLSDYDVYFDRIPEFSEVVVPVVLMLVIFFVVARRRGKGRSE